MGTGNPPPPDQPKPPPDPEKARRALQYVWRRGTAPDIVTSYLGDRGLHNLPKMRSLRGHEALTYYEDGERAGSTKAMLAAVTGKNGNAVSIHRTYLFPDGRREKKLMRPTEPLAGAGAAIRLVDVQNSTLLLAEGVESALAGREFYQRWMGTSDEIGVWATVSAGMMVKQQIPRDEISTLIICVDSDRNYVGQAAAFMLAKNVCAGNRPGKNPIAVWIFMPETLDMDMLDALNGDCPVTCITSLSTNFNARVRANGGDQ